MRYHNKAVEGRVFQDLNFRSRNSVIDMAFMYDKTHESTHPLHGHGRSVRSFGMPFVFNRFGFLDNFTDSNLGIIAATQYCCRSVYN